MQVWPWFIPLALLLPPAHLYADQCGAPHTPIASIQDQGSRSPLAGNQVAVEGIMTLDVRHDGGFEGFYLLQAAAEQDSNPRTSEGLFVHTRRAGGQPGDRIRVVGEVHEFYGLTSLRSVRRMALCGSPGVPEPQPLDLTATHGPSLEALESMPVRISSPMVITDTWNLARYGELVLSPSLQYVPTQLLPPGKAAIQLHQEQDQQRLILDDRHRLRQPRPVPYPPGGLRPDNSIRVGDRVGPVSAILDFRFGHWRLQPLSTPPFHRDNPRPPPPPRHPDANLRVVSLNLGNLFNGDGQGGGFPTSRGASSFHAYRKQLARLVSQIQLMTPDILTVSELENDGSVGASSLAALATALGPHWRAVEADSGHAGDTIRNGLLYRSDRVTPEGAPAIVDTEAFQRRHRPAIAQDFRLASGSGTLTVVAVHLKSKSCRKAPPHQQDRNDGQGCYAAARTDAARQLAGLWNSGNRAVLIAGDLNAYAREQALTVLADQGYTDLAVHFSGLRSQTFRYRGRVGTLDYHLASAALIRQVLATHIWSVNAEEPRVWAYDQPLASDIATGTPWRATDHNPVISDLRLN